MAVAKKRVLVDTCIIIRLFEGDESVAAELDRLGYENLYISNVTVIEIYRGMRLNEKAATKEQLSRFRTYHTDEIISKRSCQLAITYPCGRIKVPDGLIAATAIETGFVLYTHNRKDFDFIPGLELYNPRLPADPAKLTATSFVPKFKKRKRTSRSPKK